ncbi:hypothetical protein KC926_01250 [Candidatus Kaiserbacteria bacterium]|nr:hypothetical protein [Candidatus Kaiserbacteria bacterium]
MVEKIIVLNAGSSENEVVLKEDINEACSGAYKVDFINSNDLWIEVKSGKVEIVSPRGCIDYKKAFFFVRLRRKDSALVALICHILKLAKVGFSDKSNEFHSDFAEKSFAIPRLAMNGFSVPDTIISSHKSLVKNIQSLEKAFCYPCVVKGKGDRGESVELAGNRQELLDFAERANSKESALITIQEVVENSYDVRALFVGDEFLGAIRRTRSSEEPLLNNVSHGASVEVDEMSFEEIELCRRVVRIGYIDLCGIDFMRTPKGLVFIELNRAPQLGGIRSAIPNLSVGRGLLSLIRKVGT